MGHRACAGVLVASLQSSGLLPTMFAVFVVFVALFLSGWLLLFSQLG